MKEKKNVTAVTYTKDAILASKRYRAALDALSVLLEDGREYTTQEVDEALAAFGRRAVIDKINGRD